MRISHNVLFTHEDKTYSGAFIASASIPWGASKGDTDLGGYHLVWTRDMVQTATALLACGRTDTALRALVYLACTQRTDGSFAQNFWIDGTPYWTGIQLDEVAFPIILAWRLWKMDGLGNFDVFPFVERAAAFLVRYAPVTQQERWEETAGYSPSTLAAVISAWSARPILRGRGRRRNWAAFSKRTPTGSNRTSTSGPPRTRACCFRTSSTTTCGSVLRLRASRFTIPRFRRAGFTSTIVSPASRRTSRRARSVDAGFLELVRYGIRRADDPLIIDSLKVVDHCLKIETPFGDCWRRYNHDGYGQKKDGGPYNGWGQGRAWPLLTGERGHYELCAGHDYTQHITAIEQFSSTGGMLPEQIWDYADIPSKGMYLGRSGRLGATPGLGARRVPQAPAVRRRRTCLRPHLDRRGALRRCCGRAHLYQPRRDLRARRGRCPTSSPDTRCASSTPSISGSSTRSTTGLRRYSAEARSVGYPGVVCRYLHRSGPGGTYSFTLGWPGHGQPDTLAGEKY